jgi:peptidoglycan/LPS O-acetylase OafA/YrhL
MAYEIRGSMLVYLFLLVTAGFTPRNRVGALFALLGYSIYNNTDVLAEVPFYTGALLADLSLVLNEQTLALPSWNIGPPCGSLYRTLRNHWPIIMFVIGLYIGSYPPNSPDLSVWSQQLYNLGLIIFPSSCTSFLSLLTLVDFKWAFPLLSGLLLIFAIHFSAPLRRILSHPYFVFLGSVSFPMYLIHSFLMRSVLVWIVYGFIPESGGFVRRMNDYEADPLPKSLFWTIVTIIAIGLWFVLLTVLSTLWRDKLDGHFMKFAQYGEEVMMGKRQIFESYPLRAGPQVNGSNGGRS